MLEVLAGIVRHEGTAGLFKGLTLTWIKGPVAVAISFTLNDTIKQLFVAMHAKEPLSIEDAVEDGMTLGAAAPHAHDSKGPRLTTLESLIAGGAAGAVAKTIIAPADRIKIMFQVDSTRPFTLSRALETGRTIVQQHGVRGLWRGNGATMLRVIPLVERTWFFFLHF
jgi:solute carrier family 25 protein 42